MSRVPRRKAVIFCLETARREFLSQELLIVRRKHDTALARTPPTGQH